jgi:hypothetical protein
LIWALKAPIGAEIAEKRSEQTRLARATVFTAVYGRFPRSGISPGVYAGVASAR